MYVQDRSRIKRIGVDVLGVLCLITSALTGWLPGPGGIPLLIIGLSLLATNHEWAERLLLRVKSHGVKLSDKLFDGSPRTKLLIDTAGIACIALAVYLLVGVTKSVLHTVAISLILTAIALLLGNRKRYQALKGTRRRKS